jgi:hypothetical protein
LSTERPSILFDLATAWLIERKILLPGVSVLAWLVASVRDRAAARLWHAVSAIPSAEQRTLGHGVNTLGRMGAGIAVEFRRRWPTMYDAYVEECRSGRLRPGGIFVYQAPDRLIVNMATQRGVGRGSARLEALWGEQDAYPRSWQLK